MDSNNNESSPLISVGMPVYNGGKGFEQSLKSIINQSYENLEILISDNHSNDITKEICEKYSKLDKRIKYFRQKLNIGGPKNFEFVLKKSNGKYFLWGASDDFHSENFIEDNFLFLSKNQDFVGSTSINYLGKKNLKDNIFVDFSLEGNLFNRVKIFLKNAWFSHGIFYSLYRSEILKKCPNLNVEFLAYDWAINIFMINHGKINRSRKSYILIGTEGTSNVNNFVKKAQIRKIEFFIPFYKFSILMIRYLENLKIKEYIYIIYYLFKLNLGVFIKINLFSTNTLINKKNKNL